MVKPSRGCWLWRWLSWSLNAPATMRQLRRACDNGTFPIMHHARQALKDAGYRLTPQRVAIWEVVRKGGRHLTAEQIAEEVQGTLPEVNLSTVYRTLQLFVSLDLVSETRLDTKHSYYEVAPEPVHHHFVCEKCGAVGHFAEELVAPVTAELLSKQGFHAGSTRMTVFGMCQECAEAEGKPVQSSLGRAAG